MADFVVYTIPGSPFGRAVLMMLEEKSAPYRIHPIPPPDLKSEAHFARQPFGRIPALQHDDFMLYETQAILRYLERLYPTPAFVPADPRAAARMDQVMGINDWYLFQGVGNVIGFQRVVAPMLLGLQPDEDAIAACMPKAEVVFRELDRLLGDQLHFAGGDVSLADLMAAPQLDILSATPEYRALTADRPALPAWLERMRARPAMQATTWEKVSAMAAAA